MLADYISNIHYAIVLQIRTQYELTHWQYHKKADFTAFWKDVSKISSSRSPLATIIRDTVGSIGICDIWQSYISDLLSS